jgi:hypothetical protein
MRTILRTAKTQQRYNAYQKAGGLTNGCGLCEKQPLKKFKYWRIVENIFPYDRIAKVHHMVIPKRHVPEEKLSGVELKELRKIKESYIHKNYDFIIEATYRMKSIPAHFHLHLITVKYATGK